jgi:hypothetical protein
MKKSPWGRPRHWPGLGEARSMRLRTMPASRSHGRPRRRAAPASLWRSGTLRATAASMSSLRDSLGRRRCWTSRQPRRSRIRLASRLWNCSETKNLRESAAKLPKSFARVNLCATCPMGRLAGAAGGRGPSSAPRAAQGSHRSRADQAQTFVRLDPLQRRANQAGLRWNLDDPFKVVGSWRRPGLPGADRPEAIPECGLDFAILCISY